MFCLFNQTTNTDVNATHISDYNSIWVWGWSIIFTTIQDLFLSLTSVFLNTDTGKGKVEPVHTTKAYRGTSGTVPLSRRRWLTDFTPQPLYPWEGIPVPTEQEDWWVVLEKQKHLQRSAKITGLNPAWNMITGRSHSIPGLRSWRTLRKSKSRKPNTKFPFKISCIYSI